MCQTQSLLVICCTPESPGKCLFLKQQHTNLKKLWLGLTLIHKYHSSSGMSSQFAVKCPQTEASSGCYFHIFSVRWGSEKANESSEERVFPRGAVRGSTKTQSEIRIQIQPPPHTLFNVREVKTKTLDFSLHQYKRRTCGVIDEN